MYLDVHDGFTLFIINEKGKLKQLYTPFRVLCVIAVEGILSNTQVYVDEVRWNDDGKLLYVIFQKPYNHSHFYILMKF